MRLPSGLPTNGVCRYRNGRSERAAAGASRAGCSAYSPVAGGGSVSADLGSQLGEPGSAATFVAPASDGAGAHAHHEPITSGGSERRLTLQEEIVAGARTKTIRGLSPGAMGEPAA